MSKPKVIIEEGTVTCTNTFCSRIGRGIDIYVEAKSSGSAAYFQVVFYDADAERYAALIHKNDTVKVEGALTVKPYTKGDGTAGTSLIVERPDVFVKMYQESRDQPAITAISETHSDVSAIREVPPNDFNLQDEEIGETANEDDISSGIQTDIDGAVITACIQHAPGFGYTIMYQDKPSLHLTEEEFEERTRFHPIRLSSLDFD